MPLTVASAPVFRSRRYMVAISLLGTLLMALVLSRSWFQSDDFYNFRLVQSLGLSNDYLSWDVFGQVSPGFRLVNWFVFNLWPLGWLAPSVITISLVLATAWTLHRIVQLIAPDCSWPTLLIGALYVGSPLVQTSVQGWSTSARTMPSILLSLVACLAALRYSRQRNRHDAIVFGLALSFGLLFHEKTALAAIAVVALVWALHPDPAREALVDTVRRMWRLIVISGVIVGVFWLWMMFGGYQDGNPVPSYEIWVRWFGKLLTAGPFAALAGVAPEDYGGLPRVGLLALAGATIVGVITASIRRSPLALRAWVLLAVWYLPGAMLTAYDRAADVGPRIAGVLEVSTELAPIAVLAVTVAFTRPQPDASGSVYPRSAAAIRTQKHPDLVMVATLLPVVVLSLVSSLRQVDAFGGAEARRYYDNLRDSAEYLQIQQNPAAFNVIDAPVPDYVMQRTFAPHNMVSQHLPLLTATRDLTPGVSRDRKLLMVEPSGRMVEVRVQLPNGD